MQPMGGPPMGPMGMPGRSPRPPIQQGMSRVIPVVVSAGLAVGVFCGLLFGLGTSKRDASAQPQKASNGVKRADEAFVPESQANPNVKVADKNAPKAGSSAGSAVAATAGSAGDAAGSGGAAGSSAGSAAGSSAEPAIRTGKVVVEIKPDAVAQTAKIFVDGKEITGTTAEVELDPGTTRKKVKVVVKAAGYKDVEQTIEAETEPTVLKLELSRPSRPAPPVADDGDGAAAGHTGGAPATGGSGGKANGGKPAGAGKGKGKGSGLIDI